MLQPILNEIATSRSVVDTFGGYNHNIRIGENEFFNMENLTSDYYPAIAPRCKRGIYASPSNPQGMIAKDSLCYVDGSQFIINGYAVPGLVLSTQASDCPKKLISMGAYVIIMPDKKYVNTADLTDCGNIERTNTTIGPVTFELCKEDGTAYNVNTVSPFAPENPENMSLWIDTSSSPHTLKQYSSVSDNWVTVSTTYVKITSINSIGAGISKYDGVTISGITVPELNDLNGTAVVWNSGNKYIVITGIIDEVKTQSDWITVSRNMPEMDYITESGNRLWGCRYGLSRTGDVVNEIYASKLGDFKNWNCFAGISTDSYVATVGTDGAFTGAITHLGYPIFFKENCFHKVYGNYPANFQIVAMTCRGVQNGCSESLAIVNEVLYFKSRTGICAFDGSLPNEISYPLGEAVYSKAVAGSYGNKYYISMKEGTEEQSGDFVLFVYDTAKGLWHKEDNTRVNSFCTCRNDLYFIDNSDLKIKTILGTGTEEPSPIIWKAETGNIGTSIPDNKYVSKIGIRMSLDMESSANVYIEYDSLPGWEHVCTIRGTSLMSFTMPIIPRRCDHFRILLDGVGDAKIYSITKTLEKGSDM